MSDSNSFTREFKQAGVWLQCLVSHAKNLNPFLSKVKSQERCKPYRGAKNTFLLIAHPPFLDDSRGFGTLSGHEELT
ncbi:hypothetical protein T265_01270 [Opisthorchis viverrini]|uniref:Uncharacterized protein n=1 Tax=Opisthorchis viverrini TaxID=6198 RepID=A0A074ZZC1_OPIVI|nr:hypothetical protein T265_01270 [Opisthorchis viverrini]KER32793.1 hypothetical protein T265_01270 [Opisthorchis viverrini]